MLKIIKIICGNILFSGLIGGLVSAYLTVHYTHELQTQDLKLASLRKVMGYRYALTPQSNGHGCVDFFLALNEVPVVFHHSDLVMEKFDKLRAELNFPEKQNDNITNLIKAMYADLGILPANINDSFFYTPLTFGSTCK